MTSLYFEEAEVGKLRTAGPCLVGLEVTVEEKREPKSHAERGIIRNRMYLRNQKRETVLQCINNVLVARRPTVV